MNRLRNTQLIVISLLAVIAVIGLMYVHNSCHAGHTAVCFLTMCTLALTAAGIGVLLPGNPLLVPHPANSGVSLKFRLERPPRS